LPYHELVFYQPTYWLWLSHHSWRSFLSYLGLSHKGSGWSKPSPSWFSGALRVRLASCSFCYYLICQVLLLSSPLSPALFSCGTIVSITFLVLICGY
jgi:hypothetical protein